MSEEHDFRCPKCGRIGTIDGEQYRGQVSIMCEPPCDFHETVNVEQEGWS